jgi:hypothetical protein
MRPDVNACRDPDLLAAEVRRLQSVIAASESERVSQKCDCPVPENAAEQDILTNAEREAVEWCVGMAETTATDCEEELAALRGLLERTK